MNRSQLTQIRDVLVVVVPAVLLAVVSIGFALRFAEPAPPRKVVMSSGGEAGAYHAFAKRYADILARDGINLVVRTSAGSIANLAALKKPDGDVSIALMQGGIIDTAQAEGLRSLGVVFHEPVWLFHRGERIDRLAQLRGKRIAIGPEGSGTRHLALRLLAINDLALDAITAVDLSGPAAATALRSGEIDAVFLIQAAESTVVQNLLREQGVRVMSWSQAEAHTRRLPFLSRIVLPRGMADLAHDLPAEDVTLVAPMAKLVVREDLHPAIVTLLAGALKEVHGAGGVFHKPGEFPTAVDAEVEVSGDAKRLYQAGPPLLKRYLPFWVATFIERLFVLVVPALTVVLPLIKFGPMLYNWRIRQRLLRQYRALHEIEERLSTVISLEGLDAVFQDFRLVEEQVGELPIPLRYSEQYYNLKSHAELVRQRISALAGKLRTSYQPA